ncbi:MAG: hypothetical protein AB7G12_14715 [Thermoanaerobaculia bacterium]
MKPRSVRCAVGLGLLLVAFAGVAMAVQIPNPPPQTAAERQPYNDQLIFEGEGGPSNCCVGSGPGDGPDGSQAGCDDPTCQDTVCAFDPFCCQVEWDDICVNEALVYCTVCGGGTVLAIPAASNWGLAALAGALLAVGVAFLTWRRQRRTQA